MAAATTSSSFAGGANLLNTWDYKLSASSARSRDHAPPTLSPVANPAKLLYPPSTSHRVFPPPLAQRDFTVLKEVGDGSFGTVWLADWHSALELPAGTLPPGPSSRPEYKGKKLVAIKRMKKAFEGGWDECLKLKELKVGHEFLDPRGNSLMRDSHCGRSQCTLILFPFTTRSSSRRPRSFTLCLNAWRGISTNSLNPVKDVLSPQVSPPRSFIRSSPAWIIFTKVATFIAT